MKQPKTKASPNRVWRSGNQLIKKVLTSWWTGNHAPPPGAAPQIFDLSRRQFCQRRNLKTQRFFSLPAPSPVSAKNQRFFGRGPCKETLFSLGNGIYKNHPAPRCIFALPESATPTRVFRRIPENRRNQPLQSMAAGFVCYPAAAGGCRPCRPAASGCRLSLPAAPTSVFRRIPKNRRPRELQSMAPEVVCCSAIATGCRHCLPTCLKLFTPSARESR